jgi:hypothetical protein
MHIPAATGLLKRSRHRVGPGFRSGRGWVFLMENGHFPVRRTHIAIFQGCLQRSSALTQPSPGVPQGGFAVRQDGFARSEGSGTDCPLVLRCRRMVLRCRRGILWCRGISGWAAGWFCGTAVQVVPECPRVNTELACGAPRWFCGVHVRGPVAAGNGGDLSGNPQRWAGIFCGCFGMLNQPPSHRSDPAKLLKHLPEPKPRPPNPPWPFTTLERTTIRESPTTWEA